MASPVSTKLGWHFGVFEVDARRGELRRSGVPLKLRDQSFQILVALLKNPGEIVTREELRHLLWPSDTFVDFDHSLNTAMMKLRDALGDSTEAPIYIETIPKRGYRFVAPVSPGADAETPSSSLGYVLPYTQGAMPPNAPLAWRSSRFQLWGIGVAVLTLTVGIGALVMLRARMFSFRDGLGISPEYQLVPITTAAGMAQDPTLSPDGKAIAYVWDGSGNRRPDVYVILTGAEKPLRLTYSRTGLVGHPAWSPDGREIAFIRCEGSKGGVFIVPALGGDERMLTSVGCHYDASNSVTWSADATRLFISDRCPAGDFGLVSLSLSTGEKRCLTQIGPAGYGKRYRFSLSPDYKTIAFLPAVASATCAIYTISVDGGEPRQVVRDDKPCTELMWDFDGKSIVFRSERTRLSSLWRVPAEGGEIRPETKYPALGRFSKDGKRFVFSEQTSNEPHAIWRADLARPGGPVLRNRKLIGTVFGTGCAAVSRWREDCLGIREDRLSRDLVERCERAESASNHPCARVRRHATVVA